MYGTEVVGLLTLDHDRPGFYTPDLVQVLAAFGNQAATAIKNAQLYEQRAKDISTLLEVNEAITTKSIEEITGLIVQRVVQLTDANDGTLWLLDVKNNSLKVGAVSGRKKKSENCHSTITVSMATWQ